MRLSALRAIARKEFIQIRRDKATIYMVLIFPVMMLVLYGFGIRYDVKRYVDNYRDLQRDIDRGKSRVGIVIPVDFSRRLGSHREAVVQVIVDGADNNTATIAMNYVSQITRSYSSFIMVNQMEALLRQTQMPIPAIEVEPRIWFNPNLESVQFIVPGIIAVIMMIVGTLLTAVTIVKEKEQGTIEQIVSSPIGRYELMVGKVLPYAVLAYLDFLLIVGASYFLFGVAIKGSLALLLITAFFYLIGVLGMGILVSTSTETQMAAMMTAILTSMLPSILLSGFIFPIRQMPRVLQILTTVVPARYFIEILRDIYLKGLGFEYFWKEALYVLLFGLVTLILAARRFQKRLG
jgi:ABC-2 type transport system permease protein